MLVINPDECIDCGVCVPECPAEAIVADSEPAATAFWLDMNRKYAEPVAEHRSEEAATARRGCAERASGKGRGSLA